MVLVTETDYSVRISGKNASFAQLFYSVTKYLLMVSICDFLVIGVPVQVRL